MSSDSIGLRRSGSSTERGASPSNSDTNVNSNSSRDGSTQSDDEHPDLDVCRLELVCRDGRVVSVDAAKGGALPGAPAVSNLQQLCLARRRAVLLEMGVDETAMHPSLRGGGGARREGHHAACGDALDALMQGRA